ncbi:MAG TPA: polysaccharide deacetylase [Erysipelotrichaceae bacterium]|nr:polysaccharide deacetylase [Erysipelotrichaceae bacterium]
MKKKRKLRTGTILLVLIALTAAVLFLLNRPMIVIEMNGEAETAAEAGQEYTDAGAKAWYTGKIFRFIRSEIECKTDSQVDTSKTGDYSVTYTAEKNNVKGEAVRKVTVKDTIAPVITLVSDPEHYTRYNHPYEEEGYKAEDAFEGDLSAQVTAEEADGKVTYRVSDSSGNTAETVREIVYDDREPPVITLEGGSEVVAFNGSAWEDKFTAADDCDGDVTAKVTVEGSVDTSKNGSYTLTYRVSDEHGNSTELTRTVFVKNKGESSSAADKGHIVYLTFDDGPGGHTDRLLDILAKYDVKVTFFVTGAFPGSAHCIKRAYEEGHTVAVHTYTHDYSKVYASPEAYWNDFNKVNDIIEKQTGHRSTLFRFPGGSSNTVSKKYCKGVVTAVAQQAEAKGYKYFDWNVSSGDAGGTKETDVVYQNVISGIQSNAKRGRASVVLQHDVKGYSVDAVARIIQWGLQNGYTFMPLSENSPTAHHNIAN